MLSSLPSSLPSHWEEMMKLVKEHVGSHPKPIHTEFPNEVAQARAIMDLLSNPQYERQWRVESVTDGFSISKMGFSGLPYDFIRGEAFFKNETTHRVMSILKSPNGRHDWDSRFDGYKIINMNPSHASTLAVSYQKGAPFVSGRDLATAMYWDVYDGVEDFYCVSVEDPRIPVISSMVRAHTILAAWRLTPRDNGVLVTYICHADPKGTFPSALFKMIQSSTAQCVIGVQKYLKEKGIYPCVALGSPFTQGSGLEFADYDFFSNTFSMTVNVFDIENAHFHLLLPAAFKNKLELEGSSVFSVQLCEEFKNLVGDGVVVKVSVKTLGKDFALKGKLGKSNLLNGSADF